jgi:hypothetical protein
MEATGCQTQRYRAKPARHPARFWWQVAVLLGATALLCWQVPRNAVLYAPRVFVPFPEPRAAYVVLAPAEAAKALAGMRASWRVAEADGRGANELDMGMFDLREDPAPPAFLEQGAFYPGVWRPAAVEPLAQAMPPIGVPSLALAPLASGGPPAPQQGVETVCGPALVRAAFVFAPPEGPLPERSGECRFYLETDDGGAVVHLLLLSPASASSSVLERAIARGKARGAACGIVNLMWSFPK